MSEGEIAHRVGALHRSGIRRVMALAAERERLGHKIIHLEVGQPDFPTPPHIIEACFQAARAGAIGYTPNAGITSLREAVAERVTSRTGRTVTARNVCITSGAVNAIMLALAAVVQPGAEVLIPDPGWPNYRSAVTLVGGRCIPYPMNRRNEFKLDIEALERLITPATVAILVNSPSNPTGTVLSRDEVLAIQTVARERNLWVISDEVYEDFVFDGVKHQTFFTSDTDYRSLLVSGASKSWAMTGFRIGWLVGDPKVIDAAAALAEPQTSCPSNLSQVAAEVAVRGPQATVETMRLAYEARAVIVEDSLKDSGLLLARPKGAFYAMIDTRSTGMTDDRFVEALMAEEGVAVAPGDTFGQQAAGSIRVSLASAAIELSAGLSRIERFISKARQ